jgi:Zn-dependent protease
MFGGSSIRLARVFGIPIGVDWSWFIALFLIIYWRNQDYEAVVPGSNAFLLAVISALLFFLSILLHELGHAVVAMRNGIPILGIELMIFGGVARLGRDTDSPGVEFRVAAAGPLVTLVIAIGCFFGGAASAGSAELMMDSVLLDRTQSATTAVLGHLALVNAALLVFNLIPAFPLDGGRIARAIAWKATGDRTKATNFAATIGQGFAYVLVGLGVALFLAGDTVGGIWLGFIGVFLAGAARSAEVQADFFGRIEHIRVADVMDADPVAVRDSMPVADAHHDYFLRYGWP